MNRNHFARLSDAAAQFHYATGNLAAFGDQRPPLKDLLHVLKADDAGHLFAGPLQADPRQVPDLALARLVAGGLAVVRAVWGHVKPAHGLSAALSVWVTIEHVGGVVHCARVIRGVHADGLRAVVLRHVHRAAQAHFQPGGAATATATAVEVDNDLIVLRVEAESVLGFEIEEMFLLFCGHRDPRRLA